MALFRPAYWVFPPVISRSSSRCRASTCTLCCSSVQFLVVVVSFFTACTTLSPVRNGADATVYPMPPMVFDVLRAARCHSGKASKSVMYCRASLICCFEYPFAISSASVYSFCAVTALSPVLLPSAAASSTPLFPIRIRFTSVLCFGSASIHWFSRSKSLNLSVAFSSSV